MKLSKQVIAKQGDLDVTQQEKFDKGMWLGNCGLAAFEMRDFKSAFDFYLLSMQSYLQCDENGPLKEKLQLVKSDCEQYLVVAKTMMIEQEHKKAKEEQEAKSQAKADKKEVAKEVSKGGKAARLTKKMVLRGLAVGLAIGAVALWAFRKGTKSSSSS